MNKDLTVGPPYSVLLRFCLPLFGSVIFQQIYNIVDSLVVGNYIGENALAAVGNSYEITLIFIAFAFGCNIGCSVIVSQLFGAKRFTQMKSAISTTWIAALVLCIVLTGFGLLFGENMLVMIQTPKSIMSDSKTYLAIYVLGFPFLLFYNIATGIFSGMGDSKTPFCFLAFSSMANVVMDIWFVKELGMGVAGVAWATFICQGVSCLLSMLVIVFRIRKIAISEKFVLFSWTMLRKIARIAIPSILQQSFISIGNILIQVVINGFGPGVIAGYAASIKLNNLVITSFTTLGNGISNFTAQNIGAGKNERVREGFFAGFRMVWILCIPFVLIYYFWGAQFIQFFMKEPTAQAIHSGMMFLRIVAPFYFVISIKLVTDGILRGAGCMNRFMVATFTDLVIRVLLAFVFARWFGAIGMWCAWPVGWIVGTLLSFVFYNQLMRTNLKR